MDMIDDGDFFNGTRAFSLFFYHEMPIDRSGKQHHGKGGNEYANRVILQKNPIE